MSVIVGVLALQGAFAEHHAFLTRLSKTKKLPIEAITVRTPEELARCSALIIPGGESTTIALLATLSGLTDPLKAFVRVGKPVWGTCAGAILLADVAEGMKKGGQELLGGVSVRIVRNGFGSQVESFEAPLIMSSQLSEPGLDFIGVFIRAPVILGFTGMDESRPPIEVVARLPLDSLPLLPNTVVNAQDDPRAIVAVRQGRHLLTTFHPELTQDDRFHEYFIQHCVLQVLE